ncbi:MAG TPA: Uma2 family endonuclease [Solirubrobacteraceae bacterium]|nr:Uma2 family endonuclease [Solirubrobacteraceae bacterium]
MVSATVPVHRLSVDDVFGMVKAGVLDADDRVELVEGVLVEMVPTGPEHDGAVAWLTRHLAAVGSAAWEVRVQSTLLVVGGYLLPDLMLVEPLARQRAADERPAGRRDRPGIAGPRPREGERLCRGGRPRLLDRRSRRARRRGAPQPAGRRLRRDGDLRGRAVGQPTGRRDPPVNVSALLG